MEACVNDRVSPAWIWTAWALALVAVMLLVAANLVFGNLNQDEGWYLYAAWQVFSGKMPYRDFAFTQGPVLPCFYALFYPAIQSGGLAAGRLVTAALALAGTLIAAGLAGRIAPPGRARLAAAMVFALALVNVYQVYFCTVVKTYSLALFFITAGFLALHCALERRSGILTMIAAALLALAAGTRSSAALALPVVLFLLWLKRNQIGFAGWIYFIFGGGMAAALITLPFLMESPHNFIYFAGRFHTLREQGSAASVLVLKAGFLSRVFQAYFVCFAVWVAAMAMRMARAADGNSAPAPAGGRSAASLLRTAIWISALAISIVHLGAPFPYDDYQVFIYPLFAIAAALMLVEQAGARGGQWALAAVLGLCLVASFSSPVNQEWIIEKRELIWWRTKDKPPIVKLRETARLVKSMSGPEDLLLTQDPYLAVEACRRLPHGLEMGQFSYFPGLDDHQADAMNVLNRNTFAALLKKCDAPVAALSGYAFAIQSPQITPIPAEDRAFFEGIVSGRYEAAGAVVGFGQAATELRLFRKRGDSAQQAPGRSTRKLNEEAGTTGNF